MLRSHVGTTHKRRSKVTSSREKGGNNARREESELKRKVKLTFLARFNESGIYPNQIKVRLFDCFVSSLGQLYFFFWLQKNGLYGPKYSFYSSG